MSNFVILIVHYKDIYMIECKFTEFLIIWFGCRISQIEQDRLNGLKQEKITYEEKFKGLSCQCESLKSEIDAADASLVQHGQVNHFIHNFIMKIVLTFFWFIVLSAKCHWGSSVKSHLINSLSNSRSWWFLRS